MNNVLSLHSYFTYQLVVHFRRLKLLGFRSVSLKGLNSDDRKPTLAQSQIMYSSLLRGKQTNTELVLSEKYIGSYMKAILYRENSLVIVQVSEDSVRDKL